MDGTGEHLVKRHKPDTERQVSQIFSHVWKPLKLINQLNNLKVEERLLGTEKGVQGNGKRKERVEGWGE
jgi:hypothetical protein